MSRRRVVITGMGTVNPLSTDLKSYWHGLLAGRSGIAPIEQIDTSAFKVKIGGEVKNWAPETWLDSKTARRVDRFTQFALAAAIDAVKDSGLDFGKEDATRCGCVFGTGIGGINEYEEQHTKFMKGGGPR